MKAIFKWTLISVSLLILIPLLLFSINLIRIHVRMHYLRNVDHADILTAGRELIHNRNSYQNDKDKWGGLYRDDVLLLPPFPSDTPMAIRKLKPHALIVREDYVIIDLRLPFCRIGLIAFKEGARQFGTFKYIDSLWFWNGEKNSDSSPALIR